MISVKYSTFEPVDVLTDIYVERGIFAGCIRYTVSVAKNKITNLENDDERDNKQALIFTDYVIGNGVIISTAFGSNGYYSYVDKITNITNIRSEKFNDHRIGICHILPTFAVRKKMGLKKESDIRHIRYTVPIQSIIKINIRRDADVRLYGTTNHYKGIAVKTNMPIIISPSKRAAKIIHLLF
jgi:NAD+ kinase